MKPHENSHALREHIINPHSEMRKRKSAMLAVQRIGSAEKSIQQVHSLAESFHHEAVKLGLRNCCVA